MFSWIVNFKPSSFSYSRSHLIMLPKEPYRSWLNCTNEKYGTTQRRLTLLLRVPSPRTTKLDFLLVTSSSPLRSKRRKNFHLQRMRRHTYQNRETQNQSSQVRLESTEWKERRRRPSRNKEGSLNVILLPLPISSLWMCYILLKILLRDSLFRSENFRMINLRYLEIIYF